MAWRSKPFGHIKENAITAVELISVSKRFPAGGGVSAASIQIQSGEHFVIVGPSGSGKTTLLRLIAGLESPTSGSILLNSIDVTKTPPHLRHVGLIGQRPALYPHLDVRRNLSISVEMRQSGWRATAPVSPTELGQRVTETAHRLGLAAILNRSITGLSGGEQQRIVLGRMMVTRHPLWLLDEPLAHLDPTTRDSIRWHLHLFRQHQSPTIIEVTHDPVDARTIGDRIAVLLDGRVAQVRTPAEVYARPTSRGVATSLGWPSMNFIAGSAAPDAGATGPLAFPGVLGVRPEDVGIGPPPAGGITIGAWQLVRVDTPGPLPLWTLQQGDVQLRRWAHAMESPCERIELHVLPGREHWFDRQTGQRLNT